MSKAVDVQIALNTLIETNLPGYVKLPDAYDSPDNPTIELEKGYSVGFGSADNTTDNFCKGTIQLNRTYQLILTNVYSPSLDANYRETLEQSLINDHFTIIGQIECDPTLQGNCINAQYSSDAGIEYLSGDRKQFIIIVSNISIDYIEGVL